MQSYSVYDLSNGGDSDERKLLVDGQSESMAYTTFQKDLSHDGALIRQKTCYDNSRKQSHVPSEDRSYQPNIKNKSNYHFNEEKHRSLSDNAPGILIGETTHQTRSSRPGRML